MWVALNSPFPSWRAILAGRSLHQFLWFCVPGVLVAVLVRAWLTWALPYGIYHFDTPDFLQTPYDLLHSHRLTLHYKKTFLAPVLFTIPFLLHVPALVLIPLGQHLLGCLLVLMTGALCRLWFVFWKWWIVPLTVLTAILPALLWFEHTLLAEADYIICVVWLALAGTIFVRRPGWPAFGFLLAALLFTAGARPEGRLFLAFGVAVTLLVYARTWRSEISKLVTLAFFCPAVLLITRTAQGGLLLYASLLHLAPDHSNVAPDVGPCLASLRAHVQRTRAMGVPNDVVHVEKKLVQQITTCYEPEHPELRFGSVKMPNSKAINSLCLRLAIEIARAHPWDLVVLVADRFLARIDADSGGAFPNYELHDRQCRAFQRGAARDAVLGPGLVGVPLSTAEQYTSFVYTHYDENRVAWYNAWEHAWMRGISHFRLPGHAYSAKYRLPGLPYYYVLAAAGAILSLFVSRGEGRLFQWTFLPVLGGVWFTVMLTGALMPRYRFVLEPFWLLYLCFIPDALARLIQTRLRRFSKTPDPPRAASSSSSMESAPLTSAPAPAP
jgi:hypothetical protein